MERFDIVFDNGQVLSSGQHLSGKVLCYSAKSCDLKSLTVEIEGVGMVKWYEGDDKNQTDSNVELEPIVNYEEIIKECYDFRTAIAVLKGKTKDLSAGQHQFEFSFNLPSNLPCSFSSRFGNIGYTIEAKAKFSLGYELECKKTFTVQNNTDVRELPKANERIQIEECKYIGCFCCRSGPITCRCWIPKQGYKVGEQILFSAEIENMSKRSMEKSRLQLIQNITYHAASQKKVDSTVIYKAEQPGFEREDNWTNHKIDIPVLLPSPFRGTKLIDVDYHIKMEVEDGTWQRNIVIEIPINIGSAVQTDVASLGQPNAPMGFSSPAQQPPQGEWAYHPMPGAPINPPYYSEPSAPHPSQGGYSYHPVPSDLTSPPSYNEVFHTSGGDSEEDK